MENQHEQTPETQQEVYKPRPVWQIWAARIGLVIVIVGVILYYLYIFNGGRL